MYLLGYDVGSSSVKANLVKIDSGESIAGCFYPKKEMEITARQAGWAEQNPDDWWNNIVNATQELMAKANAKPDQIKAIGISYQMHGLVCVDKDKQVLRPSIIWCDSRAVPYGNKAFAELGEERCLSHLLNSPGNFTASKLAWVKDNEPDIYGQIDKIMLPGDYIAMRMTGETATTASGLSEGIMWDFRNDTYAGFLLDYYGFSHSLLPAIVPTFDIQGQLTRAAAEQLGLKQGIAVSYRAGDQPNNALSLNVLKPGEIAATAGTSGVVYGVSDEIKYDPQSRVNTFAHVNHTKANPRLGVLLCINGTGILNSWMKHNVGGGHTDYTDMNEKAGTVAIGSNGLRMYPFGNGAERMLGNQNPGAKVVNLNFNTHKDAHVFRAAQEGIVFAFNYGIEIMKNTGIRPNVIRAGHANMFLSPVFRDTLAGVTGASIELYATDGAMGAALGAGIGAGVYSPTEAFKGLKKLYTLEPSASHRQEYLDAYQNWNENL